MAEVGTLFGAFSGAGTMVGYVLMYLFWGLAIGGVGYVAYYLFRDNVTVNIYDNRGFMEKDKGRVKIDSKKNRIKEFELRKNKGDFYGELKPEFLIPINKTFGKGYQANFIRDQDGNIRPIKPVSETDYGEWKASDSADYKWVDNMMNEAANRYVEQSFWDKYGNVIMQTAMVSVVAVLIIVVVREQAAMVEAFNSGASNLANTFKEQAQGLSTQVINSTR